MSKILRIILWILAALVVLAVGLFTYLRSADLSVYQDQIESFASRKLGHELKIDGRFELYFGGSTRLVAEDISLSNLDWEPDPNLVHIGHLTIVIDFWSLFSAPFVVESLHVRDIRGRLETREDGEMNWVPPIVREFTKDKGEFDLHQIAFRNVQVDNSQVVHIHPSRNRPVVVSIERLTVTPDDTDILDLDLQGDINELPLWADGKLGPWQNFVDGRDIFSDLQLTLGTLELSIAGAVEDIRLLEGVEINAELSGPDIARVLDRVGLPSFAAGEFGIESRVFRTDSGNVLRVEGNLGEIEIFASGNTDSLIASKKLQLDFNIAGPDTEHVAELFGVKGAPAKPFRLTGEVARDDRQVIFDDLQLQIGPESVIFGGALEFKGRIPDGDVTISASGHDFSMLGPFIGVSGLPAESFTIDGRLQKTDEVWQANDVRAVIGENRITAHGSVTTGTEDDAEIVFHASGPDISILEDFTDLEGIPARTYDVKARIQSDPVGIKIEDGVGVFGDNRLSVDGVIAIRPGLSGTSLQVSARGPELHNVALLTGVPYLPYGPFEVSGGISIAPNNLVVENVTAKVGDLQGSAAGRIGVGKDIGRFDLNVAASGPDVANAATLEQLQQFLGLPFSVTGQIEHQGDGYTTRSLKVSVGGFDSEFEGSILGGSKLVDVSVTANAADSEVLRRLATLQYLPSGAVTLGGKIELTESDWRFTETEIQIGEYHFAADGTLSLDPRSNASDLRLSASGPSFREVSKALGTEIFSDRVFDISGEFTGTPSGFAMRDFLWKVGDNDLNGEFDVDLREKPRIVGVLSSSFLDVSESLHEMEEIEQEAEQQTGQEKPDEEEFLFSDKPLNSTKLQAADIDLEIRIDKFIADALNVTDLHVGFVLQDGALRIDPFKMRDDPGSIDGKLSLVPNSNGYALDVSMAVDEVHMRLMASRDQDPAELPPLGGTVTLRGQGNSLHTIMTSSNGEISLRHGAGRVRDSAGSRIFADILVEILRTLNPLQRSDVYRTVDCGIYDIEIVDGIATFKTLALQTSRTTMVASGQVRLDTEKLAIAFRAKPREGIGIGVGTVTNAYLGLGGTLRSPQISLDALNSVAVTGAAVATGGLTLLARGLWDRMSAESSICEE